MARATEKLSFAWFLRHPLTATCILLALTILLPYLRVAERLKLYAFLPVARAADEVAPTPAAELTEDERLRLDLKTERERTAALAHENAALAEALRHAGSLSALELDFAQPALPKAVAARVMFHGDSSGWRHSLWINRGRKHGIEELMPVVAGRTLIGRTFLVGDQHACVQLLTDPGFAASCLVLDPAQAANPDLPRVRGVLRGDGSALPHFPRLELEDVAIGAEIRPGMAVLTSDYGGHFPLGLAVGTVREVIPQAGFLQVRLEAGLNLASLDVVEVLLHRRPELEQQALALLRRK
ncbi:MAG: rod shape-determining protein MreC [Planctomycetes bacterium]|nr:rod shape-determining protein MreC [Planctomycetota bacterium]